MNGLLLHPCSGTVAHIAGSEVAHDAESKQDGGADGGGGTMYPAVALALGFMLTHSGDKEYDDEVDTCTNMYPAVALALGFTLTRSEEHDDENGIEWDDEGWVAGEADDGLDGDTNFAESVVVDEIVLEGGGGGGGGVVSSNRHGSAIINADNLTGTTIGRFRLKRASGASVSSGTSLVFEAEDLESTDSVILKFFKVDSEFVRERAILQFLNSFPGASQHVRFSPGLAQPGPSATSYPQLCAAARITQGSYAHLMLQLHEHASHQTR